MVEMQKKLKLFLMLLGKERAQNFLGKDIQTGRLQKTRNRQTLQSGRQNVRSYIEKLSKNRTFFAPSAFAFIVCD